MIMPVVNRLCPMPVFLFHVIALLPFVMTNVFVMMFVVMVLSE